MTEPTPIGATAEGDPVSIDLDALIGGHACIVANSGGGKSGAVRRLLEVTNGQVQQIVLDIEDEFYTLRERCPFVIAGGDGADAPATLANADALARTTLESGFSLIVQLNDLGEQAPAFVGRFLSALIAAPRELWRPLLVVLDEAHRFAPQDGRTEASAGVKALTGQGRKRGFTAVLATQRIAKLDADVRGDVNNWLLGRVGQSLDRNTMADALGFGPKEGREKLRGIVPRWFYGFGPAIAAEPLLLRIADVETTPVRPGQAKVATPPAPDELGEILAGLAAAAAPAGADSPDDAIPADTQQALERARAVGAMLVERDRRIAELEAACATAELNRDLVLGVLWRTMADIDAMTEKVHSRMETEIERRQLADANLHPDAADSQDFSDAALTSGSDDGEAAGDRSNTGPPAATAVRAPRGRKALEALARIYPARLTETLWATLAGYARSGGTWGTYKGELRRDGLVDDQGGLWGATRAGVAAIGGKTAPLPPPGPDRARFWSERVPGSRKLVEVLVRRWPHWTTREALASDAGMAAAGGTYGTYLGRLRSNGLLEEQGRRLRLAPSIMGSAP